MYLRLVAMGLCALFWGFQADANILSIDCSRTQGEAEQEICRTPALVRLDEIDLALFRALRASGGLSEATRAEQRAAFLSGREDCDSDGACLNAVYRHDMALLVKQLGVSDQNGGYWAVATDGSSVGGLTLRRKASSKAKALEVIPAAMPLLVLDQTNLGWWKVQSLTTGTTGWVPRTMGGRATLTYQPVLAIAAPPAIEMVPRTEVEAALADVASLKAALSDVQSQTEQATVPRAAFDQQAAQLAAANQALADQHAKEGQAFVSRSEFDQKVAELAALNAALSELRAQTEQGTVPRADFEAQAQQLAAANQALADLQAKLQSEFVARADFDQKVTELAAVNAALSDMRLKVEEEFVPREEYLKTFAELDEAAAEIADLNRRLDEEYVPRATHEADVAKLMAQIDALNQSVADQRETLETQREQQVSALNATLVDSQSRIDTLKRRLSEVQTALSSFIEECKADVDCANAMSLQP